MLQRLQRLRLARHLSVLAILLMVGIGQHAHGAMAGGAAAEGVLAGGGEAGIASILAPDLGARYADGHPVATAGPHCGQCHAIRGLLPLGAGLGAPLMLAVRAPAPTGAVPPALLAPDVPSPPPRPERAA